MEDIGNEMNELAKKCCSEGYRIDIGKGDIDTPLVRSTG